MSSGRAPSQPEGALPFAEKLAWLRLIRTENIGPISFYNMIDCYGSAEKALAALPALAARSGRKKPLTIPPAATTEKEYARLQKSGGDIICACEPDYPLALAATEDAPPVITIKGRRELLRQPGLAVVGARNASLNGRKFARTLAQALGQSGQVIISGMARGIDTAAHEGALATGTIAVLAGGLDIVYPPENQGLYEAIAKDGLIIAENPPGTPPRARDFPRRNRIVSGLSAGVIVVEATERSGSLITARLAGEQGRDVYAVPGHPLDPRASGPNRLIRDGALLVRDANDILEALHDFSGGQRALPARNLNLFDSASGEYEPLLPEARNEPGPHAIENVIESGEARRMICDHLSYSPVAIDDLIRATGIGAALTQTILLELELAGEACRLPGGRAALMNESVQE